MKDTKKETGFYMIYLDGCSTPSYKHATLHGAKVEARRLSSTHDRKAYILKTKITINTIKTYEEIKTSRPDEDALPF